MIKRFVLPKKTMRKKCVLVLSMHRSGSSCCSGSMGFLGKNGDVVSYGKHHSLEKNRWNEKGFFENDLILRFNIDALDAANGSWKNVREWTNKEENAIMSKLDQLKEIIQSDYLTEPQPIFLIKDPRIIWLWNVYMKAFEDLDIETYVVHIDRDDIEVAKSLWDPHKIPYDDALKLTSDYKEKLTKDLDKSIPNDHIYHTTYVKLINNPTEELKNISDLFALPRDRIDFVGLSQFIDKNLKHH